MDLTSRKSIRLYDKDHKIPRDIFENILKDSYRAPSSMNLQPWRLTIVESDLAKERLKPALYGNLTQLETSSAMVVVFGDTEKFKLADTLYSKAVKEGKMSVEVKEAQLKKMGEMVPHFKHEKMMKDLYVDCGLLSLQFMQVAKSYGYDTCAIGGYNADLINDALGVSNRYVPVLVISIGKAKEQGFNSVRLDVEDVTTWL